MSLTRTGNGLRSPNLLAWLAVLALVTVYLALPDANDGNPRELRVDDSVEEGERLEIFDVSPHDPFPGGTIAISHSPARGELEVLVGKRPLRVLARRGERIVAELPDDSLLGDLKVRIATLPDDATRVKSKAFHIRVRAPSYRKLFRSLVGGVALVVLGVFFLARGVRGAIGLRAARLLSGASKRRGLLLGVGALLGALAQTTTGAIGVLSGLVSSRVMGVVPGAIAALAAPLGAALAPLVVAGLIAPREGLLFVAIGVLWLMMARGRRWQAVSSLALGSGLLAFGLHVFRPALEPFLADAALWRLAGELRVEGPLTALLCAGIGALAVALLHGPAPLIVLLLGIAQATQHADLRTLLALLAGTSAGAALAGLITAPAGSGARVLARTNLAVGVAASLLSLASVNLWVFLADRLLGPQVLPLHWTERTPVSELGVRLSLGFGLSQLLVCVVLAPWVGRISALLGAQRALATTPAESPSALRQRFDQVLKAQQTGLSEVSALAMSGERRRGQEAEQALAAARREVEQLVEPGPLQPSSKSALDAVAFSLFQLQNALDHLLHQTERLVDARIADLGGGAEPSPSALDPGPIEALHALLSAGLEAARHSLSDGEPLDIDAARSREIQMNRIEADTRGVLLQNGPDHTAHERLLWVLQVVDAYEASGNQVYRLAELLCQPSLPFASTAHV